MSKHVKVVPHEIKPSGGSSGGNVDNGKICAALAYILIGIIWFFVDENMKKNAFAKFHVKQGLVLLVLSIGLWIVMAILGAIFSILFFFAPMLGFGLMRLISLIGLIPLVLCIIGIVYALQGKEKQLPIVGQYADKFNI